MVADIDIDDDNELVGDIDQYKISDIANKTITAGMIQYSIILQKMTGHLKRQVRIFLIQHGIQ